MLYRVNHHYASGGRGPWEGGELIDLDDETAAWVERDSPGCLSAHAPEPPPEPVKPAKPSKPKEE